MLLLCHYCWCCCRGCGCVCHCLLHHLWLLFSCIFIGLGSCDRRYEYVASCDHEQQPTDSRRHVVRPDTSTSMELWLLCPIENTKIKLFQFGRGISGAGCERVQLTRWEHWAGCTRNQCSAKWRIQHKEMYNDLDGDAKFIVLVIYARSALIEGNCSCVFLLLLLHGSEWCWSSHAIRIPNQMKQNTEFRTWSSTSDFAPKVFAGRILSVLSLVIFLSTLSLSLSLLRCKQI